MIFLKRDIFDRLKDFDEESCGFIFGYDSGRDVFFEEIKKAENISGKKNEFRIGLKDVLETSLFFLKKDFGVAGVFHVHKNSFFPSGGDIKNAFPNLIYMICCGENIFFYRKIGKKMVFLKGETFETN